VKSKENKELLPVSSLYDIVKHEYTVNNPLKQGLQCRSHC